MTIDSIITILSGLIETGIISIIVLGIIKGLSQRVSDLQRTIGIQNDTILAMEKRVLETEKISSLYKSFLEDYPKVMEQYKSTIVKTKDDVILELRKKVDNQIDHISDLERNIKNLDPSKNKLYQKISSSLLNEDFNDFASFLQNIPNVKTDIVTNLINSTDFSSFLELCGLVVIVDDEIEKKVFPKSTFLSSLDYISFFGAGLVFAFSNDNKVYFNAKALSIFSDYYRKIRT